MSYLNEFLDRIHRMYRNDQLPDIVRGEDESWNTEYSKVWLKGAQDPDVSRTDLEKAKKLNFILQGIAKVVEIVYGSKAFKLVFLADQPASDRREMEKDRTVYLSIEPLKTRPKDYTFYDLVDVMTGSAIHEAAHMREQSADLQEIGDDQVLLALYHLIEDVIADQIVAKEFPGFEGYLLKYRRYFIDGQLVSKWGMKRYDRVNLLILALRSTCPIFIYKKEVKRAYLYILYLLYQYETVPGLRKVNRLEVARNLYAILFSEKLFHLRRDINYMAERLILGQDGPPTPGEDGRGEGGKSGVSKKKTMEDLIREEKALPLSSKLVSNLSMSSDYGFEQLKTSEEEMKEIQRNMSKKDFSGKGWLDQFQHNYQGSKDALKQHGIKQKEWELIEKLQEEKFSVLPGVDKNYRYQVHLSVPAIDQEITEKYQSALGAVRSQLLLLQNQLAWANTKTVLHQYGLKSGMLDEDALYQARYSSELFMKPIVENSRTRKMDMILLVDGSSSMNQQVEGARYPKFMVARQLCALFVEALEPIHSIQTWVYTFYQETAEAIGVEELYSPQNAQKARIGAISPGQRTPEYEALLAIGERIQSEGRKGVQKVIVVLSDGQPGDDIIPYHVQKVRIKTLVQRLESEGHIVIQVSLGSLAQSKEMYKHSIPFPDGGYFELIPQFGKLLRKLLEK
jgi:hypothetical protein